MTKVKQKQTKSQHFLPQMYLRRFSDDEGMLWVYDKQADTYSNQHYIVTAVDNHAYTIKTEDGLTSTDIESYFSGIEGNAVPVLEKVDEKVHVTLEDKAMIATFISYLRVRTPSFRKEISRMTEEMAKFYCDFIFSSESDVQRGIDSYERSTGKKMNATAKEMVEAHKSGRSVPKCNKNFMLSSMMMIGTEQIGWLDEFDWIFTRSSKKTAFVTSDKPFILLSPPNHPRTGALRGVGIATKDATKLISLSTKTCLQLKNAGDGISHSEASNKVVRSINCLITTCAERFVIARDKPHLESLVKMWEKLCS